MTRTQYAQSLSSTQLKSEIKKLDHLIYVEDCYGINDMALLLALQNESEVRR